MLLCVGLIEQAAADEPSEMLVSRIRALYSCRSYFSVLSQAATNLQERERLRRISAAYLAVATQEASAADPNKDMGNVGFAVRLKGQGDADFNAFLSRVSSLRTEDERFAELGAFGKNCKSMSGLVKQ